MPDVTVTMTEEERDLYASELEDASGVDPYAADPAILRSLLERIRNAQPVEPSLLERLEPVNAHVWNDPSPHFAGREGTLVTLASGVQRIIIRRPERGDEDEESLLSSITVPKGYAFCQIVTAALAAAEGRGE